MCVHVDSGVQDNVTHRNHVECGARLVELDLVPRRFGSDGVAHDLVVQENASCNRSARWAPGCIGTASGEMECINHKVGAETQKIRYDVPTAK